MAISINKYYKLKRLGMLRLSHPIKEKLEELGLKGIAKVQDEGY